MKVKNYYCSNPKEEIHYAKTVDVDWEEVDSWEGKEQGGKDQLPWIEQIVREFVSLRGNIFALLRWLGVWVLVMLIGSLIFKITGA